MLADRAGGAGKFEHKAFHQKSAGESIGETKTSSTDLDGIAPRCQLGGQMDRHEPLQHCGEVHAGRLSFKCNTNLLSLRTAFGR